MTIPGHTVAAKTGTSNKRVGRGSYPNNNVLIGYTPSMVVGVWVGNTDGSIMRGNAWGFADAGPIWKYFFSEALKDSPDEKFTEPPGLIHKGRELYPTWVKYKNFDTQFKKVEETQETQAVPESDFFARTQQAENSAAATPSQPASAANAPAPAPAPVAPEVPEPAPGF